MPEGVIVPPLWAAGQAAPGRQAARPAVTAPCVPGQPGSAASRLGEGWQRCWECREKENKEEQCLQTPSLAGASRGERGLWRGAGGR